MNKSTSHTIITLEKDVFTVGESIRVSIKCDNSKCRKPIEGIAVKLLRNVQCVTHDDEDKKEKHANHQKYVKNEKLHEKISAKQNIELATEINIPDHDDYHPASFSAMPQVFQDAVNEEFFPMM